MRFCASLIFDGGTDDWPWSWLFSLLLEARQVSKRYPTERKVETVRTVEVRGAIVAGCSRGFGYCRILERKVSQVHTYK